MKFKLEWDDPADAQAVADVLHSAAVAPLNFGGKIDRGFDDDSRVLQEQIDEHARRIEDAEDGW